MKKRKLGAMDELYQCMKKVKTDDEGTKRFLLGLHYLNNYADAKEITIHSNSGDISFLF